MEYGYVISLVSCICSRLRLVKIRHYSWNISPYSTLTRVISYMYMSVVEKKFESYFRDRLTFSNVDSRTSRRIYRLALLLRAPETLSSFSKSRISIFNAHLTLLVRKMASHNSIGKYRHLVNWLGTCLGKERRRLQTRLVECRTGRKWISGAPLFTLVIFYFHEGRQHNIDDVCVEFCWILFILELIYSSDFHEGRKYFMLMLVLNFAF